MDPKYWSLKDDESSSRYGLSENYDSLSGTYRRNKLIRLKVGTGTLNTTRFSVYMIVQSTRIRKSLADLLRLILEYI